MLGLAIGIAFLTGFGAGAIALIVWIALAAVTVARSSVVPLSALLIVGAGVLGVWYSHQANTDSVVVTRPGSFEGIVRVSDGPFLTQSGQRFLATANQNPEGVLCVYAPNEPQVFSGDRVFATGRTTLLSDLSQVGEAAARTRGCDAQLRIESMRLVTSGSGILASLSHARVQLSEFLMQSAPGDVGALMSGLVTGEDGGLSTDAGDAFRSSGTTHITAISGANFALIVLLLGVIATGSMRRNAGFLLAATVVIWMYAAMVDLQPSSLRAALLATAVLLGRWLGRRPDLLTLTLLLAALQIAIRPRDFDTLAFQLSLAATLALVVVFDGSERTPGRSWYSTLTLSVLAAQLSTIPILAYTLGTVSGIGLVANLVVGPLAGLAFPIALVGALIGQLSAGIGEIALLPARWLCEVILYVVEWAHAHLPGSVQLGEPTAAAMGTIALACWLWILWLSGDLRRMARHAIALARSW